jgi:hypothetical protein
MIAAAALLAVAACGRGDRQDVASADSLNRDLQLAPVDTTATLNDRPSADTTMTAPAAATSKPKPKASPKPVPAGPAPSPTSKPPTAAPAPAAKNLAAGTSLSATTDAEIRSNKNKVGDEVTATVATDVKDASGRVVIPAGSLVTLQVTAIKES